METLNQARIDEVFDMMVLDTCAYLKQLGTMEAVIQRIKKVMVDNCRQGKGLRLLTVCETGKKTLNRSLSEGELERLLKLGWLVEILQAYLLINDDIMDGSTTRRGRPCWHLQQGVGMDAINDAALLKSIIYVLLERYFASDPAYIKVLHLFNRVAFLTEIGQSWDGYASKMQHPSDWNMAHYLRMAELKTGYYTFYISVLLALHCLGSDTPLNLRQSEEFLIPLGRFYQEQNEYLDIFGEESQTGKKGSDIQEKKCTWLVIQALELCDSNDREAIIEHYSKPDAHENSEIQSIFERLPLRRLYEEKKKESLAGFSRQIKEMETSGGLRSDLCYFLLEKISNLD